MTKQSSSNKHTGSKGAKKAHYPAAKISNSTLRANRAAKVNRNEKYGLVNLVEDICAAEENSITAFLDTNADVSNRHIIKHVLTSILHKLPEKLQQLQANNMDFEPELSKENRLLLQTKARKLQELQDLSNHLQMLEENADLLREETGLWLGKLPADITHIVPKSVQVAEIAGTFKSQLESMNNGCDKLLAFAQECKNASLKAEHIQRKLYEKYQNLRKQVEPIADARDSIRNFQRLPNK